jgi:hypothetical protein
MGGDDDVHLSGDVPGAQAARIVVDLEVHAGALRRRRQLIVAVGRNDQYLVAPLTEETQHLRPEPTGADQRDLHASSKGGNRQPAGSRRPFARIMGACEGLLYGPGMRAGMGSRCDRTPRVLARPEPDREKERIGHGRQEGRHA